MTKNNNLLEPIKNTSSRVHKQSHSEIDEKKEQVAQESLLKDLERIPKLDQKINSLLSEIDSPERLKKASTKDLAIAVGVLSDKRQAALDSSVGKKQSNISMRVAWKNGTGAVELTTGDK